MDILQETCVRVTPLGRVIGSRSVALAFILALGHVGCGGDSPSAPSVPVVLTGTWVGTAPDGLVFARGVAQFCDHDVTLNLTQSGNVLSGTFTSEARVTATCVSQSYSTLEVTTGQRSQAQVIGRVNGASISLRIIASRLSQGTPFDFRAIVASGMFTANRLTLTGNALITRSWTDANGDRVPDCDLVSAAPNGECGIIPFPDPQPSIALTASRS